MKDISFPLAFLAGLLSFLSPCVLPLVPSYVSFITGFSFESLTAGKDSVQDHARIKRLTFANSVAFVLGFSSIFIGLGASSSMIGRWLMEYEGTIRTVGGVLVIIFGLFISGIVKLDFLMRERKIHLHGRPVGYLGAFVIGMTFAAGWTPCIGPILGSILLYATSKGSAAYGLKLLATYSLGLAVPFLAAGLAINSFLLYSRRFLKHMKYIMLTSGVVLMGFGVLLLSNKIKLLSRFFPNIDIGL